ncbi:hypothetical protein DCAR_0934034 [Daucus carota subsp. sativus]|uniref:3-hydroxyisobutyryl-CoA hydrolase n=1 Tax=Daucus carota subsp. sativus TaxID=79200 RepID=A0AAF0XV24_DAUCS|nr:hypothetical protein DCAR_0934034 [Daucus carota subsp. sativus]
MYKSVSNLVLEETCGSVRIYTLNRTKQLNALSFAMISRLLELFHACDHDPSVKLIIMKGNGRAFCAGGDVAAVVRDISKGDWKLGANYFRKEFTLNYLMATYSKPQVSFLNGIVMGGGAGASIHGRFRIATENSVFAMPETALGLFPDVGASYYLSRLRGFFGEYVGLTGARLDGAEMLACGLATHFVPLHIIDKCFSRKTVEEIISVLESKAVEHKDEWITSTVQTLKKASPTSLKISLRSIREGRLEGVGECLVREYRMVCCVMKGEVSRDFFEGCRALLLDKDKNPNWQPSRLECVTDEMVDRHFSKVDDIDWEDLKLPPRSNLPVHAIAKL